MSIVLARGLPSTKVLVEPEIIMLGQGPKQAQQLLVWSPCLTTGLPSANVEREPPIIKPGGHGCLHMQCTMSPLKAGTEYITYLPLL